MTSFLNPRDMFQEYIDEQYENQNKYRDYIMTEMQMYALEAEKKMEKELKNASDAHDYIIAIADSYSQDIVFAKNIFKKLGLNKLHAWAALANYEWFKEDFELLTQI